MIPTGSTIAVVAPASAFQPEKLEAGLAIARAAGHELVVFDGVLEPHRYLASDDATRRAHLVRALTDPAFSAVWAVRGGYGVTRLLDDLPWHQFPPRPVIGFSDLTPLLDALRVRCGSPVVHGPVLHSLGATDAPSRAHLFDLLAGRPTAPLEGTAWVGGTACGPLVGGNLAMIAATMGTPFQLDTTDAILMLEDVGEAPFRIDRMLTQLRSGGLLDGLAGVALGEWPGCQPRTDLWRLEDVLLEHLGGLGVPVVADLPIGHGAANRALPLGARATLGDAQLSWATATPPLRS